MLVNFQQQQQQIVHHYTVSGDVDCGWLLDTRVSEGFVAFKTVERTNNNRKYIILTIKEF